MRPCHLILAILVVIAWGFNFVVIEIGLHEVSPLVLCAIRFLLTSIPAVLFFKRPNIPLKTLTLYGSCMFALQFGFLFAGIHAGVTSGLAALIMQSQVFFTLVFAALFLNERPNQLQIISVLISFSGIALVGIELESNISLIGFIFLIIASASWGIGNLITKKIRSVNMFSLVVWGNLIAFPPTCLAAFLLEGKAAVFTSLHQLNALTVVAILYIVFISTMFGYGVWSLLLKRYPITTIAPFALLVPIVGFLSSALVLQEPLEHWKIAAAVLVILGLSLNFVGTRRAAQKARIESKTLNLEEAPGNS